MKRRSLLALCLWTAATSTAWGVFVSETDERFQVDGDFNDDGVQSPLLVDRTTGLFIPSEVTEDGTLHWGQPRPTGVPTPTAVAAGDVSSGSEDWLAVTSPEANRVLLHSADLSFPVRPPTPVYPGGIGPAQLALIDVEGTFNSPEDDVVTFNLWDNASPPTRRHILRLLPGPLTFPFLIDPSPAEQVARAQAIELQAGLKRGLALLGRDGGEATFLVFDFDAILSGFPVVTEVTKLPNEVDYCVAPVDDEGRAVLVFYTPGSSELLLVRLQSDFSVEDEVDVTVDGNVQQIFSVALQEGHGLFIIFDEGERASFYRFDEPTSLTETQSFELPDGFVFYGASGLEPGRLAVLSGLPGAALPTNHQVLEEGDPGQFSEHSSGLLPVFATQPQPANVFVFRNEPFVSPEPQLLKRLQVFQWSSDFALTGAPGDVEVTRSVFEDSSTGLRAVGTSNLGAAPADAGFGLASQVRPDISLTSLQPADGDVLAEIRVTPPGGVYAEGFPVNFTNSNPTDYAVFYTTDPTAGWTQFNATSPPFIAQDTTLRFYGEHVSVNLRTPVQTVQYSFLLDGAPLLDSDDDLVPDVVELAYQLDPNFGADTDSDGFSDLAETLLGTDPNDPNDFPMTTGGDPDFDALAQVDTLGFFELAVSPQSQDGSTDTTTLVASFPDVTTDPTQNGTRVAVHDLRGNVLQSALTLSNSIAGAPDPSALMTPVTGENEDLYVVVGTEPNFDVQTPLTDKAVGRELVGLVPIPETTFPTIPFTYVPGSPASVRAAWAAAVQNYFATQTPTQVATTLDYTDTLALLLTERILGGFLFARGLAPTTDITLTGYRETEFNVPAGTEPIPQGTLLVPDFEQIAALSDYVDGSTPSYQVKVVAQTVLNELDDPTDPSTTNLLTLAEEVYAISAALANAEANRGLYPNAVDVLRDFLSRDPSLPATLCLFGCNYEALLSLSPAQLDSALSAVARLQSLVPMRPFETRELVALPTTTVGPCFLWRDVASTEDLVLLDGEGDPFFPPDGLAFPPGTVVAASGFTDLTDTCATRTLQVVSLQVVSFPGTPVDGLLDEGWQLYFFGQTGIDPFSESGGVSFLQQFLDGTDPTNDDDNLAPVDLSPPMLQIAPHPSGYRLSWDFPAGYADDFQFQAAFAETLADEFNFTGEFASYLGLGQFELIVPDPGTDTGFWVIDMTLVP